MPIPKPNAGEAREDFISRCMGDSVMNSEYPDQSQRAGVCNTQWDQTKAKSNMELETREIKNVEIMDEGEWKGNKFGPSEFDEAITNFNGGVIAPYINIDHDNKLTKKMQDILGVMSMGFVSKLYRNGTKLMADFKQVPKLIAELIQAGALKQKSVEWWHEFKSASGKKFNNVLECVTFFGANGIPAVNTLNDVVNLFQNELQIEKYTDEVGSKATIQYQNERKGENIMPKIEVDKAEYDGLVKMKADGETAISKMKEDHKKEIEAKDATIADLSEYKEKVEADKKVSLKSDAGEYVDGIIKAEKLLPKYKDMKVSEYIQYASDSSDDGKKNFDLWKDEMENREKVIVSDNETVGEDGKKVSRLKDGETDDVKIDEAIKAEMEKSDCSYAEAGYKLHVFTKTEAVEMGFDPKGGN